MERLRHLEEKRQSKRDIELYTGIDFDYDAEVVDIIADTLRDQGIYHEKLILSGHSLGTTAAGTPRAYIFAQSFAEYRYHQEFGPIDPLQAAIDNALVEGGLPAISIYDGSQLERDPQISDKYHSVNNQDVEHVKVARFIIH